MRTMDMGFLSWSGSKKGATLSPVAPGFQTESLAGPRLKGRRRSIRRHVGIGRGGFTTGCGLSTAQQRRGEACYYYRA
ncbi:hypothetical protein GCM10027159_33720 [Lysobacter terrae]